jgi:predicted transcriptional regulator
VIDPPRTKPPVGCDPDGLDANAAPTGRKGPGRWALRTERVEASTPMGATCPVGWWAADILGSPGPEPLLGAIGNTSGYTHGMAKVMVSLPDDLVHELDTEARRRSTSRSALLAAAARRELARPESGAVAEAVARSERRFRAEGPFDAAELVRRNRDSRR